MDFKLIRRVAIASLLMIFLVVGLVVYFNYDKVVSTEKPDKPDDTEVSSTSAQKVLEGKVGDDTKAFLNDETFFDEEVDPVYEAARLAAKTAQISVMSVEKDLRIVVSDGLGRTITGQKFTVSVKGIGNFKDIDCDGEIYIGGLTAGDYEITLDENDEYTVNSKPVKCKVKDRVEYVAIEDISRLIKTEEEITASEEDTCIKEAVEEGDNTQITDIFTDRKDSYMGIDVSKWQKEIDWNLVKDAGIDFAIIRCGYRGTKTGTIVKDPYFDINMENARKAGIKLGVYFYTQALNEVEAVEEASAVISLIKDKKVELPVFIDVEPAAKGSRANDLDKETRTFVCDAFLRTVENAGYTAGIYSCRSWYNDKLDMNILGRYFIWLAEYRKEPLYKGYYKMWQYTSKGSVPGIEGNVDMNILYIDKEEERWAR
ncbi:MAG: glycoside hydrolase family 25 protein [Lachnospiraceae bacterium]|nr:glycoside hydrolase family 25 protein [Lachnospiraceae bacterium]